MKTILRVFTYLKRYPSLALAQLFCAIVGTLMVIVFPMVTKHLMDDVIPQQKKELILPLVLLTLGSLFLRDFLNSLRIILNNTFEQKVIYDLRSDLYQKIQQLPLKWFDNRATGDVMTRVSEDVTSMERVLIDGIEQGGVALLQVLIVGTAMFFYDARLALLALAPTPLLLAGVLGYTLSAPKRYRLTRKATSAMNSLLHDNIDGIRQIKSYTMEKEEHRHFNRLSENLRQATLRVMRMWALYNPSMNFLNGVGYVLVLGFGAYWFIEGSLEKGTFVFFLLTPNLFYDPFSRLHQLNQILQAGRAAGERVFEIMDSEEEAHAVYGEQCPPVQGHVVYENVSFSYEGSIPTIQGVSLEARPGETVALVGETGAGKSTIINLLTRFYEYDSGAITIDGYSIAEMHKTSLREKIGYVTQESFLFNGTVRENLLLAKRQATDAELWQALEIANASGFVNQLPKLLDTRVGERGIKLSVGEKQRISIARALLKNPPILLLDEATASVDMETERLIQSALEKLMVNRTSFVIAHRLSTIKNADRIYVMNRGQIVEQGKHEELLHKGGYYAALSQNAFLVENPQIT